jgi:hypothetical protein
LTRYREALQRFVQVDFGDDTLLPDKEEEARLRDDLKEVIRSDTRYFNIFLFVLLILFVGSIWFVLANRDHPAIISSVFGVTGLSSAAILNKAFDLQRERTHSEAAYLLAARLPVKDLKAVVIVLLNTKGKA